MADHARCLPRPSLQASRQAELDATQKRAISFLQEQASDARSGGQKGTNWKKNLGKGRK